MQFKIHNILHNTILIEFNTKKYSEKHAIINVKYIIQYNAYNI